MSLQTATRSSCLMAEGVGEAEAESKHTSFYVLPAGHAQLPRCSMRCVKTTNRFVVLVESTIATEKHRT